MTANGTFQLVDNQFKSEPSKFDWVNFVAAGATGALSASTKFNPTLLINVGGAMTASTLKDENPNMSMAAAAVGTGAGFPLGAKVEKEINKSLNPWYREQWKEIGGNL